MCAHALKKRKGGENLEPPWRAGRLGEADQSPSQSFVQGKGDSRARHAFSNREVVGGHRGVVFPEFQHPGRGTAVVSVDRRECLTQLQAIEILDNEAEEDESFREELALKRPQSHEANSDLIVKHSRYLKLLEQASASDKQVQDKWDEWRENIEQLCWDEASVFSSETELRS